MKNQKESFPVLFENKNAFEQFLSNLKSAEKSLAAIAENWNSLEVGEFDKECLENIYRADFFKTLYANKVWEKIEKVDLPKAIKQKLFTETSAPDEYNSLLVRLDALHTAANRWGRIAISGGVRSFDVKLEYFQIKEGTVSLVPNIEEIAITQFQILGDSPEKIAVFKKLDSMALDLTELSELLEKTGLYKAFYHPVIEQSPLFLLRENRYEVNAGILL